MPILRFLYNGFLTQIGFFSRLPLPVYQPQSLSTSAWAAPLAGLLIGASAALPAVLAVLCFRNTLPSPLDAFTLFRATSLAAPSHLGPDDILPIAGLALLTMAVLALVTGLMHEDAWADSTDALFVSDPEIKWRIAHDPHCGPFAIVALIMLYLVRWVIISALIASGLLLVGLPIACALARTSPFAVTALFRVHQKSPSLRRVGKTSMPALLIAAGCCFLLVIVVFPVQSGISYFVIHGGLIMIFAYGLARKSDGLGGDQLGVLLILSELISMSAFLLIL